MCLTARVSLALVSTHSSRSGNWNLSAVTPACRVWSRSARASGASMRPRDSSRARRADPPGRPAFRTPACPEPCREYPRSPGRFRRWPTEHRTASIEAADVHQLVEVLDLHRVAADEVILQVHHAGHGCAGFAFERGFAPSHDPLVGFDLHEHIGPVRLRDLLVQRDAEHAACW